MNKKRDDILVDILVVAIAIIAVVSVILIRFS